MIICSPIVCFQITRDFSLKKKKMFNFSHKISRSHFKIPADGRFNYTENNNTNIIRKSEVKTSPIIIKKGFKSGRPLPRKIEEPDEILGAASGITIPFSKNLGKRFYFLQENTTNKP